MGLLHQLRRKKRVFLAFLRALRITLSCYDYSVRQIWRHRRGFKFQIGFLMFMILPPASTDSPTQPTRKSPAESEKRTETTNV